MITREELVKDLEEKQKDLHEKVGEIVLAFKKGEDLLNSEIPGFISQQSFTGGSEESIDNFIKIYQSGVLFGSGIDQKIMSCCLSLISEKEARIKLLEFDLRELQEN